MPTQNPLLDDLAGLMTGALGAARSAGEEARTAMRGRADSFIADMDLAGREEVEVLKEIARAALERVEALEARVEALEAAAAKPKRAAKPKSTD
ncbi:MAG: accessory factor UbiK family protein [Hyphomonadaceae bacterium]